MQINWHKVRIGLVWYLRKHSYPPYLEFSLVEQWGVVPENVQTLVGLAEVQLVRFAFTKSYNGYSSRYFMACMFVFVMWSNFLHAPHAAFFFRIPLSSVISSPSFFFWVMRPGSLEESANDDDYEPPQSPRRPSRKRVLIDALDKKTRKKNKYVWVCVCLVTQSQQFYIGPHRWIHFSRLHGGLDEAKIRSQISMLCFMFQCSRTTMTTTMTTMMMLRPRNRDGSVCFISHRLSSRMMA